MKEFSFIINEKFNNYKIIDFLKCVGISDEIIKKVKFGGIFLDERLVKNINERVKSCQTLKMVLPKDEPNAYVTPIKGELKIIYEDEYLLAVVKPKGMHTHASKSQKLSLDQLVCGYFLPESFVFRAINRLDKDTSGIILIAKDMYTASLLGEQMKKGNIKKSYQAVIVGTPKEKHFFIEKPIKRQAEGNIKRVCDKDGKYAKTECMLVKTLDNGNSILDIILHTGRTHQIRVHLASVGLPLYADGLYGERVKSENYELKAKNLEFIHPFTGKNILLTI